MDYLALAPVAFLVVLALVCAIGTPYRNSTPRQKASAAPQATVAPPRAAPAQSAYPPPASGHRYVLHNGQLVQVRV